MGLLDRFRSAGEEGGDDAPDFYRVVRKTPKGGWKTVENFDEMDEPIDKDTFEYNAAPLDPGEYRLFYVVDHLNQQPPEGVGWTLQVDGTPRDEQEDGEMAELKREIRALREEVNGEDPADPQEAVERQKANLQLAALQSEDFLKRYGDTIIMSMFDDGGGGPSGSSGMEYDDWQENPIGASLYETMNMVRDDPEQVERLGEAIGRGVGTFAASAADGYADGDGDLSLEDARGQADAPAAPEPDEQDDTPGAGRDLDAGPSDLDDLTTDTVPVETEELAADLAEARTNLRRAGPGEQDRADDAPAKSDAEAGPQPDTPTDEPTDAPAPPAEAEPDATDAASPDPDPMTAAPDADSTTDREKSADERVAAIAEDL